MKTQDEWKQMVLLAESGELSPGQRRKLDTALARDPELLAFQETVRQTQMLVNRNEAAAVPSDFALHQIMDAASRASAQPLSRRIAMPSWRPAWVYGSLAAALLLMIGMWWNGFEPAHVPQLVEQQAPAIVDEELTGYLDDLFGPINEVAWLDSEQAGEDWWPDLDYL